MSLLVIPKWYLLPKIHHHCLQLLTQKEIIGDSHIILLKFSLGFGKCIQQDYIPSHSSVQTKMQPCQSTPTLFASVVTYLEFPGKSTIPFVFSKIYLKQRISSRRVDKWATYPFTAYLIQTSKLLCWTVTNSIFNARLSIDAAVCMISSLTCSWWLPSSLWIAGYGMSPIIGCWMSSGLPVKRTYARGGNL